MALRSHLGLTYHNMSSASVDEVAAATFLKSSSPTSGMMFARKLHQTKHGGFEKDYARHRVLWRFNVGEWPRPRILTMPGLRWRFERLLIGCRRFESKPEIYAVENDAPIFRASLRWMPGIKHRDGLRVESATRVTTNQVASYEFIDVERYIASPDCPELDAAWLDFTGFMTLGKMDAIRHLWNSNPLRLLIVTSLAARYSQNVTRLMRRYGGLAGWFQHELCGVQVLDVYNYCDGAPIIQVTLGKAT